MAPEVWAFTPPVLSDLSVISQINPNLEEQQTKEPRATLTNPRQSSQSSKPQCHFPCDMPLYNSPTYSLSPPALPTRKTSGGGSRLRMIYRLALEFAFNQDHYPSSADKTLLAGTCKMTYKQVNVWFQNRRDRSQKPNALGLPIPNSLEQLKATLDSLLGCAKSGTQACAGRISPISQSLLACNPLSHESDLADTQGLSLISGEVQGFLDPISHEALYHNIPVMVEPPLPEEAEKQNPHTPAISESSDVREALSVPPGSPSLPPSSIPSTPSDREDTPEQELTATDFSNLSGTNDIFKLPAPQWRRRPAKFVGLLAANMSDLKKISDGMDSIRIENNDVTKSSSGTQINRKTGRLQKPLPRRTPGQTREVAGHSPENKVIPICSTPDSRNKPSNIFQSVARKIAPLPRNKPLSGFARFCPTPRIPSWSSDSSESASSHSSSRTSSWSESSIISFAS